MKILMVNKYLYPVGGAENYMFSLASALKNNGIEVQFFGIESEKNIVGNDFNLYSKCYENSKFMKLLPWTMIYSNDAKKKIKKLIKEFNPDIVHMNNINFQLTTSIIDACKEMNVPVVMTIHDPQLVCPNHRLFIEERKEICERCLDGNFKNCLINKCFKNSKLKSYIGYRESVFTHKKNKYDYISKFICPSLFIKGKLIQGNYPENKMVLLRNFCSLVRTSKNIEKKDYILYYGRLSEEKGLKTLLDALPNNVKLVIAGTGPYEKNIPNKDNIEYVGFKKGQELIKLIEEAKFTVYPSEWYENSPLSVIESISLGTPVIGTNLGGITELIQDNQNGLLFKLKDIKDLRDKINYLYFNEDEYERIKLNCKHNTIFDLKYYVEEIEKIYKEVIQNEKINK